VGLAGRRALTHTWVVLQAVERLADSDVPQSRSGCAHEEAHMKIPDYIPVSRACCSPQ
jgi:hypothetical protein